MRATDAYSAITWTFRDQPGENTRQLRHRRTRAPPPITLLAMLRQSTRALKLTRTARSLHTQATKSAGPNGVNGRTLLVASTAAATAGVIWYSTRDTVHNDAPPAITTVADSSQKSPASVVQFPNSADKLETLVWGSNKCASSFTCILDSMFMRCGPSQVPRIINIRGRRRVHTLTCCGELAGERCVA